MPHPFNSPLVIDAPNMREAYQCWVATFIFCNSIVTKCYDRVPTIHKFVWKSTKRMNASK